jgi:hypothetical protein
MARLESTVTTARSSTLALAGIIGPIWFTTFVGPARVASS